MRNDEIWTKHAKEKATDVQRRISNVEDAFYSILPLNFQFN